MLANKQKLIEEAEKTGDWYQYYYEEIKKISMTLEEKVSILQSDIIELKSQIDYLQGQFARHCVETRVDWNEKANRPK